MDDKEKLKLKRLNARYKRQNDKIKKNYYRVSATLPKSAEGRIKALGLSINELINRLVLAELDRLEAEQKGQQQANSESPF